KERDLVRFRLRQPWEYSPALPKGAKKSPPPPLPLPQEGRGASNLLIDSLPPIGGEDGRKQGEGEKPPDLIRSRSRAQFFQTFLKWAWFKRVPLLFLILLTVADKFASPAGRSSSSSFE